MATGIAEGECTQSNEICRRGVEPGSLFGANQELLRFLINSANPRRQD